MRLWRLALAAHLLLTGCGEEAPRVTPIHRFVDAANASAPTALLPTATLRDETRLVLRGHAHATLVASAQLMVTLQAHASFRPPLPASLAGSERLLLESRMRIHGRWIELPVAVADVVAAENGARVAVEIDLPRSAVGATVRLAVEGFAMPSTPHRSVETPPVEIPRDARLEFGIGVQGPGDEPGSATFSVQACAREACDEIFRETVDPTAGVDTGWRDRVVALDAQAGRAIAFRFETETAGGVAGPFAFPVWSNPTVFAPAPEGRREFNVLLFSLDTLRADHLPTYGYPLDTAPFIEEKFRREGTVVDAFVAAATSTGPSHMTLFTSLQPSVHGIRHGLGHLAPEVVTLAQALRGEGFETAAVTEDAALAVYRGFGRGFNSYVEKKSLDDSPAAGLVEETLGDALRWLERHGDRRFFLFVHTYQVHYPYTPPERYADLFAEPAPGWEPDPLLSADRAPELYDREIRYLDEQLREFFEALDGLGLARDTLVVVTSDHGEEFMEHGGVDHGPHLNAEVTHVPLLLAGPGVARGRRLMQPLGHLDLMPTLLELAGIPVPQAATGRSFAPQLRPGAAVAAGDGVPLYGEAWRFGPVAQLGPPLAVRVGQRKLIRTPTAAGAAYAYYELADDPREERNRYGAPGAVTGDLEALIERYAAEVAARVAARPDRRNARFGAPDEPAVDPDREAKLRALGYVE